MSLQGPFPRHYIAGNLAPFEEMPQRWQAVGNTVFEVCMMR